MGVSNKDNYLDLWVVVPVLKYRPNRHDSPWFRKASPRISSAFSGVVLRFAYW